MQFVSRIRKLSTSKGVIVTGHLCTLHTLKLYFIQWCRFCTFPSKLSYFSLRLITILQWFNVRIVSRSRSKVIKGLSNFDHLGVPNLQFLPLVHLWGGASRAVRNIWSTRVLVLRHQNSGARPFFKDLFPLLRACLCWQCSDKIRKYRGHIETVRKKRKSKSWCWFLRLKQKTFFYIFEGAPELWCLGTRTLVPQPFLGSFSGAISKRPFFAMGQKDAQF